MLFFVITGPSTHSLV